MQFILVALAFMGSALALPAAENIAAVGDMCCCCDISKGVISCTDAIPKDECVCAAVQCPDRAPTIFPGVAPGFKPTPTPKPAPVPVPAPVVNPVLPWWFDLLTGLNVGGPQGECCCCDPSLQATTCRIQSGICICPAIACPSNAPTVWPFGGGPRNPTSSVVPRTTALPASMKTFVIAPTPLPRTRYVSLDGLDLPV
jgi:hypothetical protein